MKSKELNERVLIWAENKGILKNVPPIRQIDKTLEEVNETMLAVFAYQNKLDYFINSKGEKTETIKEIKDGLGDVLVTVNILCEMFNTTPDECLEIALNVIEKRTGKIENGQFVKDK